MDFKIIMTTLAAGQDLKAEEMTKVMSSLVVGEYTDAQIAALLVALRAKGESAVEITAAAQVLLQHSTPISFAHATCLWQGKYFLRAPVSNSEYWAQRYAVVLQRNAWLEDTATMEDTQTALKSGALDKMNLQDGEIMIRHSYDVIENRINGARAKEEA